MMSLFNAFSMFTLLIIVTLIFSKGSATPFWTYDNTSLWGQTCASGQKQSPIDINRFDAVADPTLSQLKFTTGDDNDTIISGQFFNAGNTVQFGINKTISIKNRPRLSGGGLTNVYIFELVRFHWGTNSTDQYGSEHTIDNTSAPVEVHFSYYNSKYPTLTDAMSYNDGIATVGFFMEPSSTNNPPTPGIDYGQLTRWMGDIAAEDAIIWLQIDLGKLIPTWLTSGGDNEVIFYKYNGSLSAPPCLEVVKWFVYERRLVVPKEVLDRFWLATTDKNVTLVNTHRPVQKLPDRIVKTNRAYNLTRPTTTSPLPSTSPIVTRTTTILMTTTTTVKPIIHNKTIIKHILDNEVAIISNNSPVNKCKIGDPSCSDEASPAFVMPKFPLLFLLPLETILIALIVN